MTVDFIPVDSLEETYDYKFSFSAHEEVVSNIGFTAAKLIIGDRSYTLIFQRPIYPSNEFYAVSLCQNYLYVIVEGCLYILSRESMNLLTVINGAYIRMSDDMNLQNYVSVISRPCSGIYTISFFNGTSLVKKTDIFASNIEALRKLGADVFVVSFSDPRTSSSTLYFLYDIASEKMRITGSLLLPSLKYVLRLRVL